MTDSSSSPDWDALLRQSAWVRGLASSLVADPSTADDIVQQTWLAAAEHPPKHGRNLRSWIGSVVRGRARKHWRSEQAVTRKHDALGMQDAEAKEAIVERMETVRLLAEGVAGLKEPYATAIYLRFYEELSMREIAMRQGIPLNTAQTHVSRGLVLLREKMESKVGHQWRNRCLVFAIPLPAASSLMTGTTLAMAMTLKTKLALGAALILLASLAVVEPWAADDTVPQVKNDLAAADALVLPKPTQVLEEDGALEREAITSVDHDESSSSFVAGLDKELIVTVIDGASLQPVPEVEIVVFDFATVPDGSNRWAANRFIDKETHLEKYGVFLQANEHGQLHFPLPEGPVEVMARTEDLFGYGFTVNRDDSSPLELEIILMPVVKIRTRVLDQNGNPIAGIRVGFTNLPAAQAGFPGQQVLTGEDGRAVFEHAEIELHKSNYSRGNTVAVGVPSSTPLFLEFASNEVPTEEIVFTLPALGDLVVHCLQGNGDPIRNGMPIELQAGPKKDQFERLLVRGQRTAYVRDGIAKFENIGIGTELLLVGYSDSQSHFLQVAHPGIQDSGETVEIEMIWPHEPEPLMLRLVDDQGVGRDLKWVDAWSRFANVEGGMRGTGAMTYVSENGVVELKLGNAMDSQATKLFLSFDDAEEQKDGTAMFSVLPFDLASRDNPNAFGTQENPLVLRHGAESMVGGQCVDPDGSPLAGVELYLHINPLEDLNLGVRIRAVTAADGSFRFLGEADPALYQVELFVEYEGGYLFEEPAESIPFEVGQTDLVVMHSKQVTMEGRVLLGDTQMRDSITVQAVYAENYQGPRRHVADYPDGLGGRFTLQGVNPDVHSLIVKDRFSNEVLARRDHLPLGDRNADGVIQLPDWDLRGLLHRHSFTVTSFDGKPILKPILAYRTDSGRQHQVHEGNSRSFLSLDSTLDVWVSAPGYSSKTVTSSGETEVQLEKGIQILLSLPSGIQLPEGYVWKAELFRANEAGELSGGGLTTLTFDTTGEDYAFEINRPGIWMLSFKGEPENADWETMTVWWAEPHHEYDFGEKGGPWVLEIDAQSDGQSFVLPITQEGVEATL